MENVRRFLPNAVAIFFSYLVLFKIDLGLDWIAKGIVVLVIFGITYNVSAWLKRRQQPETEEPNDPA